MSAFTSPLCAFVKSSIGRKIIVAFTGLALVLFLAGHLTGNLLIYAGREAFNDYAQFLHEIFHGAGIWIARAGLLACFVIHIWFTILLTRENKAARPKYAHQNTVQASKSSLIMIWSGLTILAFVIFHLLHFTVKAGTDYASFVDPGYLAETGEERHDSDQHETSRRAGGSTRCTDATHRHARCGRRVDRSVRRAQRRRYRRQGR